MSDDSKAKDFEVGYGKPPISGRFKKGMSGNPAGRPKKALDFDQELVRELHSPLTINENWKRKSIKKYQGVAKQLVNKALSGNLQATRLLMDFRRQSRERAAELQQRSPYDQVPVASLSAKDLTDDELAEIIRAGTD